MSLVKLSLIGQEGKKFGERRHGIVGYQPGGRVVSQITRSNLRVHVWILSVTTLDMVSFHISMNWIE